MKTFHIITYRQLFALLTLGFGSVCMAHAEVNSSSTQQVNGLSSGAQTEENKDENLLDQIQDGLMQPQRFSGAVQRTDCSTNRANRRSDLV